MGIQAQASTNEELIRRIAALSPPAGNRPDAASLAQLTAATQELIALFRAEGKLEESPIALAMNRTVHLHREAAQARLEGQRVLVTGGAGCVGSRLIPLLADLGAAAIAIVDIAEDDKPAGPAPRLVPVRYQVDIRDVAALDAAFAEFRPQVVFHLAGIREPGRAEAVVREAIETNVFGIRNVIDACLRHQVEDAIYSSTGKCFAYVSDHVYTGSKKLAEAQWAVAARSSTLTRFRCTRFTHIVENGVVAQDIAAGIRQGLIGLHGPDRYFNIQNLRQATHLLINALALAAQTPADGYWSAVDLGWPVQTLELALYSIHRSGTPAAIYFLGVPRGYDEIFFRGQFCWDGETEYHPLVNALEASTGFGDSSGTMIGARIQPFDGTALALEMEQLSLALDDPTLDFAAMKKALHRAVAGLARSIFAQAELAQLVNVLWWGAAPAWAGPQGREAARFSTVIGLLTQAIVARQSELPVPLPPDIRHKLGEVAESLAQVDNAGASLAGIRALLASAPTNAGPAPHAAPASR